MKMVNGLFLIRAIKGSGFHIKEAIMTDMYGNIKKEYKPGMMLKLEHSDLEYLKINDI